MMLPTPSTSHLSFQCIYEPAEDSFLLLDCLSSEAEAQFLRARFAAVKPCPIILEVGTGSGVVVAFSVANSEAILGRGDVIGLGTDINGFACRATEATVAKAFEGKSVQSSIFLDCLMADLSSPMKPSMVDILIFNPPYVPTADPPSAPICDMYHSKQDGPGTFLEESRLLELSYAGGKDGMEVTNRLLEQLPHLLTPQRGVAYILLCAQNQPSLVKERVLAWGGNWRALTVATSGQHAGWERLQIIRIWRDAEKLGWSGS